MPVPLCTLSSTPPISIPQSVSGATLRTLSPPVTRSRAAAASAVVSGTSLFTSLSCYSPCSSLHPSSITAAFCTLPYAPSPLSHSSPPSSPSSSRGSKHPYNLRPRVHPLGSHLKIAGLGITSSGSTPLICPREKIKPV